MDQISRAELIKFFDDYLKQTQNDWNYITPTQLYRELKRDPDHFFLLDVRQNSDYVKGHIAGSVNVFWLNLFEKRYISYLPHDQTIVLICYLGHTASQLLTLLKLLDYDVVVLKFGMGVTPIQGVPIAGWNQFGFPIEHHHLYDDDNDILSSLSHQTI